MSRPNWRATDFVQCEKCGQIGYSYNLVNDYDQVIASWARGTDLKEIKSRAEYYADNLNEKDGRTMKQNAKLESCSMTYTKI